jgi:hypothetical protein
MSHDTLHFPVHPVGEQPPIEHETAWRRQRSTPGLARCGLNRPPQRPLTPYGQLPFFIEYLKVADLFGALVADCLLTYTSPRRRSAMCLAQ